MGARCTTLVVPNGTMRQATTKSLVLHRHSQISRLYKIRLLSLVRTLQQKLPKTLPTKISNRVLPKVIVMLRLEPAHAIPVITVRHARSRALTIRLVKLNEESCY